MPIPHHPRIIDSLNRPRTLDSGPESFTIFHSPSEQGGQVEPKSRRNILVLGIGGQGGDALRAVEDADNAVFGQHARPKDLPKNLPQKLTDGLREGLSAEFAEGRAEDQPENRTVWVECPAFEQALALAGEDVAPPKDWQRLTPDEAVDFVAAHNPLILLYRQASHLFPEFWGPLCGRLRAASLLPQPLLLNNACRPTAPVFLPGTDRDLLHLELCEALTAEGRVPLAPAQPSTGSPRPEGEENSPRSAEPSFVPLLRQIEAERPAFFLSVNLRGLDPAGETFHVLRAMGVPVAVWFVDNPWHILSSLRLPWWKDATLFVTDATFIPELNRHGAAHVFHLPLAASSFFLDKPPALLPGGTRALFVGRSAFPRHDGFFAAVRETASMPDLAAGSVPHFHWWTEKIGLHNLWPGHDVRRAGAEAEASSLRLRADMLAEAAPLGLTVIGDEGWRPILPSGPPAPVLLPPVDYYTTLPCFYRAAPYTLNATSLLLPGGLTQRHFDVWQAGGFLLSNDTPGLDLFPAELTRPIVFNVAQPLRDCVEHLDAHPGLRRDLQQAWQKLIMKYHTYHNRIHFLTETLTRIHGKTLDG